MSARTRHDELKEAAYKFHKAHPEVGRLFEQFALEKMREGRTHYSADAVMHRVRWETNAGDTGRKDGFKINDHHVAFYGRAFNRKYNCRFFRPKPQPSKKRKVKT